MSALNLNHICLAGRLTRDPVLRKTSAGTPVADIGLACHETYADKTGKQAQHTHYFDVVAWNKSATTVAEYLTKGDPLIVEGSLVSEQWETQQGEKRNRVRIRAGRIHFLGAKREKTETPCRPGKPPTSRAPISNDDAFGAL